MFQCSRMSRSNSMEGVEPHLHPLPVLQRDKKPSAYRVKAALGEQMFYLHKFPILLAPQW